VGEQAPSPEFMDSSRNGRPKDLQVSRSNGRISGRTKAGTRFDMLEVIGNVLHRERRGRNALHVRRRSR